LAANMFARLTVPILPIGLRLSTLIYHATERRAAARAQSQTARPTTIARVVGIVSICIRASRPQMRPVGIDFAVDG
jgi:hypothetical protein